MEHSETIQQKPILAVTPLPDKRLRMELCTGSILELNMSSRLETMRYYPLQNDCVFNSVSTDGCTLHFSVNSQSVLEINLREAILMALNPPPNTYTGYNPFHT